MRVRVGKVLLYGSSLATGGTLLYVAHKSGYDPNNIGSSWRRDGVIRCAGRNGLNQFMAYFLFSDMGDIYELDYLPVPCGRGHIG
jgi:hypothetical protein